MFHFMEISFIPRRVVVYFNWLVRFRAAENPQSWLKAFLCNQGQLAQWGVLILFSLFINMNSCTRLCWMFCTSIKEGNTPKIISRCYAHSNTHSASSWLSEAQGFLKEGMHGVLNLVCVQACFSSIAGGLWQTLQVGKNRNHVLCATPISLIIHAPGCTLLNQLNNIILKLIN